MTKVEENVVESHVRRPLKSPAGVAVWFCLLAAVALTLVLPVWIVQYPPLLDYPNHLARSFVLSHLHDPAYHFDRYYDSQWGPFPYIGMDISLIALQYIFPVQIAGKLFLSLVLLAVPLAFWFFLRQANPGNDALAFWALLVACNEFFLESFVAFQLSLACSFVFLGFWVRWTPKANWRRWLILLALTLATYFAHLIGFILAGFVVTLVCVLEWRGIKEILLSWLLFVPGSILFIISGLGIHNGNDIHFRDFDDKVDELIRTFFNGFSSHLVTVSLWTWIACIALFWAFNRKRFHWNKRWPFVTVALLAFYWALPYSFGSTFDIDVRVLPLLFLSVFAVANIGSKRAWILGSVALVLFGFRIATITKAFRSEQHELQSISRGVAMIRPGSKVLPIVEPRQDVDPINWCYEHFSAWTVMERGAFSPYLFDLPGQTPMRITYEIYSPDAFWDSAYDDTDVDWDQVQDEYDYVWAYNVERFSKNMASIGKLIYQDGAFQLYEVHKPAPE